MKTYNIVGKDVTCKREQINDNWYYVMVWEEPESISEKYLCIVQAYSDGSKMSYISPSKTQHSNMETLVRKEKQGRFKVNMEKFVSMGVNEAVTKLENKQQKQRELEDNVLAALEANKEVHEGIDYELSK
jgi:hypothetical protein